MSVEPVQKENEKEVSRQLGGATVVFVHTVGILAELTNGEAHISRETADLEALKEQEDRYKLWGSNFNAQSGGLEKLLDGAGGMRETILPILCRIAEATVVIARQWNLAEALEAVFQQIEEIKKQTGDIRSSKPTLLEDDDDGGKLTIDDFGSSESEGSSNADESAVAAALRDIKFLNELLYNVGPALYDNAERMGSKRKDSSTEVNKGQVTM